MTAGRRFWVDPVALTGQRDQLTRRKCGDHRGRGLAHEWGAPLATEDEAGVWIPAGDPGGWRRSPTTAAS